LFALLKECRKGQSRRPGGLASSGDRADVAASTPAEVSLRLVASRRNAAGVI